MTVAQEKGRGTVVGGDSWWSCLFLSSDPSLCNGRRHVRTVTGISRALAAGLCIVTSALGGDALGWEGDRYPGGMTASNPTGLALKKVTIEFGPERIVIDYDIFNATDVDITTDLQIFDLPYYYSPVEDWGPTIRQLNVKAEGRCVQLRLKSRATVEGKDVTAELEAAGIDYRSMAHVDTLAPSPPTKGSPPSEYYRSQLALLAEDQVEHWIEKGMIFRSGVEDRPLFPGWRVEEMHSWRQLVPAKRPVRVTQAYEPVAARFPGVFDDLAKDCGVQLSVAALKMAGVEHVNRTQVGLDLAFLKAWSPSIAQVELRRKEQAPPYVASCWYEPMRWKQMRGPAVRVDKVPDPKEVVVEFIAPK